MSVVRIFPQDIINCILDELQRDFCALSACALASRSLRPLSQQHLYSSISLDLSFILDSIKRVADLREILTINPSLANNIHHLSISVCDLRYMFDDDPSVIENMEPVSLRLLSDNWEPIETLRMLPRLHKISISGGFIGSVCTAPAWDSLDEDLRAFICDQMQSPLLTGIHLDFIDHFPLNGLTRSSQLQRLYLKSVTLSSDANSEVPLLRPRTPSMQTRHLIRLSLTQTATASAFISAVHTPHCTLSLYHLRELSISDVDSVIGQALLDMCTQSLETFKAVFAFLDCDHLFMNLTRMKKLKSFHLSYSHLRGPNGAEWLRKFLIVEAHLLPVKGPLKTFELNVRFMPMATWKAIDDTLTDAPCLKTVHICLMGPDKDATASSASEFCQSRIPRLSKRGNFSIVWREDYDEEDLY